MKHGRYYTIALYGINSFDAYVQIAMTESMCDLMRMREWVIKTSGGRKRGKMGYSVTQRQRWEDRRKRGGRREGGKEGGR